MGKRFILFNLVFMFCVGVLTFQVSYAKFSSSASNKGNVLSASSSFPSFITVIKQLYPNNDSGKFNLFVDTLQSATNISHNGSTNKINISATDHQVSETAGTSSSLNDYITYYYCKDNSTTIASGSATISTSFSVASGKNLVCTFGNFRKTGSSRATCAQYCTFRGFNTATCIKNNDSCPAGNRVSESSGTFECTSGSNKDCCCQ